VCMLRHTTGPQFLLQFHPRSLVALPLRHHLLHASVFPSIQNPCTIHPLAIHSRSTHNPFNTYTMHHSPHTTHSQSTHDTLTIHSQSTHNHSQFTHSSHAHSHTHTHTHTHTLQFRNNSHFTRYRLLPLAAALLSPCV
jgi:hypothetical protein